MLLIEMRGRIEKGLVSKRNQKNISIRTKSHRTCLSVDTLKANRRTSLAKESTSFATLIHRCLPNFPSRSPSASSIFQSVSNSSSRSCSCIRITWRTNELFSADRSKSPVELLQMSPSLAPKWSVRPSARPSVHPSVGPSVHFSSKWSVHLRANEINEDNSSNVSFAWKVEWFSCGIFF